MQPRSSHLTALAGLLILAGALPTAAIAAGTPLLAHRAVYDLSLAKSDNSSSAPVSARGRIVYEFTGSPCEGWVTNFRQLTQLQMNEGGERTSDMRSATFEEGDGTGFQFKTDTLIDGKLVETIDGRAKKAADGVVSVSLTKPEQSKDDMAAGALFPTAQILRIVDIARAGEKTASIKIFDGSDTGHKVFDTLTVIGHRLDAQSTEASAINADSLKGVARWPVSVSYFDPAKPDSGPNYILGFDLYENGVSGALRIDYGSYVLEGKMAKFEPIPQKSCDK